VCLLQHHAWELLLLNLLRSHPLRMETMGHTLRQLHLRQYGGSNSGRSSGTTGRNSNSSEYVLVRLA
jgi:hypothetical protein